MSRKSDESTRILSGKGTNEFPIYIVSGKRPLKGTSAVVYLLEVEVYVHHYLLGDFSEVYCNVLSVF